MTEHYDVTDLVDYTRGVLGGEEAERLFTHCQQCEACGDRLGTVLLLRQGQAQRPPTATRRRLAVAAAVAVVGLALTAASVHTLPPPANRQPPVVDPEAAAPGVLAAFATHELPRPGFLMNRFNRTLPAALYSENAWVLRVEGAARMLWAGDLDGSIPAFREFLGERPGDPEIHAYLGIALYLSGRVDTEVEEHLRRGVGTGWETLSRYSLYYLANHFLRTGQDHHAFEILEYLALLQDNPGTAAIRLLEQLRSASPDANR